MATNEGDRQSQTIFNDVFRRADKNDDGALSWEEFKTFFQDGISSDEELSELFKEIDTHHSNNLDVGELCEFFKQHLGKFSDVFKSLEGIGSAVTNALTDCHQKYPTCSFVEQFSMRFLLREVSQQLGIVQQHLDTAIESIEDEESAKRDQPKEVEPVPVSGRQARRMMRKMKSYQQQTSIQAGGVSLECEVNRLAELIDKLEGKISFDFVEEMIDDVENEEFVELVCRKFVFDNAKNADIKACLKSYAENIRKDGGCLGLSIYMASKSGSLNLFEVWRNKTELNRHLVSDTARKFQRNLIDCLLQPEDFNRVSVPGSWWKKA